jgi:hypothetical protein
MLYAFPFGLTFASVNSSKKAVDTFHEMYALDASYKLFYMNLGDVELTLDNRAEISSHFQL